MNNESNNNNGTAAIDVQNGMTSWSRISGPPYHSRETSKQDDKEEGFQESNLHIVRGLPRSAE